MAVTETVTKIDVHRVCIDDTPGSLQKLLSQAAQAGVDMHCLIACSTGAGKGCVYLSAKDPASCDACAKQAGIETTKMVGFELCGEDKIGAAAEAMKGLADAGINGVAASAMVCDGKYHLGIIVDAADAEAAGKALGV